MGEPRVETLHPDPAKRGPRIPRWKYAAVRDALLEVVPGNAPGVAFQALPDLVRRRLSKDALAELGSVSWHVTVVKLDLEARGKLTRIKSPGPQRLRRSDSR